MMMMIFEYCIGYLSRATFVALHFCLSITLSNVLLRRLFGITSRTQFFCAPLFYLLVKVNVIVKLASRAVLFKKLPPFFSHFHDDATDWH